MIKSLKSDPSLRIKVDAGNFSYLHPNEGEAVTEAVLAALMRSETQAVSPAFRDLRFGAEFLRTLEKKYDIPFVSVNLLSNDTGKQFFPGHRILEAGEGKKLKIAVMGLVKGGPFRKMDGAPEFKLADPATAINEELSDLPKDVDFVLLLTDSDRASVHTTLEQMGKNKDRIDFILSCNTQTRRIMITEINGVFGLNTGRQGKNLTTLSVSRDQQGSGWEFNKDSIPLGSQVDDDPETILYLNGLRKKLNIQTR